ncbi:inositol 1,4,5-trisphosphate-gated calcium channel ITPR1-like isoform X2 [Dysidea avara]|uniref:inositol 1,4,5-trisphosphate-gated calcium channel ITPR1-like isoform X2 n=1 Tax=Dysidea avara TaxID=196820 RepID=UPI00332CBE50
MAQTRKPNPSLLFGDVVFLHCKSGGYIFSELSSTTRASILVFPVPSQDQDDPNFPNLKMAAFKILPANQVHAQRRLADLRVTLENVEGQERRKELIMNARKNAQIEIDNNNAEQERLRGTLVYYGQTIQLLHLFSGKYVAAKPVETSKTESTSVKVELSTESTEQTFLKILSPCKVKSIGYEVNLHDQVSFQFIKAEGQYLKTSKITYGHVGISLYGHCHEVNMGSVPSAYTLKPHYQTILDDEKEKYVTAGSVVRLFHRESECYVVAEGSFANKEEKVKAESVHLRKRKSDHGKLRPPSTSAITYWQIEKDIEPLNGQAVLWEECCRLRHLPTRLYLAIVKDERECFQVTLKERDRSCGKDWEMVFKLIPLIQEDAEIKLESHVRIQHLSTEQWISAVNTQFTHQSFDSKATGLGAVPWDTATLKQIRVTQQMNYDDAFTIEEVDHRLIEKFNIVAEVIPVIKEYITEKEEDAQREKSISDNELIEALDVIIKFVDSANVDLIDRQKLLRYLMIIEMIVKILEIYENVNVSSSEVVKKCYELLHVYLKGNNWKNEFYMSRFIPVFTKHIGCNLKMENMLIELSRDNLEVIVGHDNGQVKGFIEHLCRTQDPHIMDYLGVLCVCQDHPITQHQDYIIEELVCHHGKNIFYITEIRSEPSFGDVIYCKPGKQKEWINLHSIKSQLEYHFLVAQLDLFAKLCKGNNKRAIEIINTMEYMSFNEALTGAKDTNLDSTLRLKYVELIIVLYVDNNEDNRPLLENLSLSFNYEGIRANPYEEAVNDQKKALTGAINDYFPDLRDWIICHIGSLKKDADKSSVINDSIVTAHVLKLLHILVKYGFYANLDDINKLMPLLLFLLHSGLEQHDQFENTEENKPIFELKIMTLKVLNLFFNFRFYLRLQHYIFDYKLLKDDESEVLHSMDRLLQLPNYVAKLRSHFAQNTENSYPMPDIKIAQLTKRMSALNEKEELMGLATRRVERIFSFSSYDSEDSLPETLLGLLRWQNNEILTESLQLLNRYYSSEEILFQKAIQAQLLINPESKKVLTELYDELLPSLHRLLKKDVDSKECDELIEMLQRLTSLCYIQNVPHQSHSQNQKILYNSGVYTDVLARIMRVKNRKKRAKNAETTKSHEQKIVSTCLVFLKALARNHKVVQEQLFDCMDDLLEIDIAALNVAELLTEVFTGGTEICLRVRETQINHIFDLIVKSESSGRPEWLEMLRAIVKTEDIDLPLKRNQKLVIKYFNLSREKFCAEFLGKTQEKQKMRAKLLQANDSDYCLHVFLRAINLLAACCEGKNLLIESLCQDVISIDEIMKILNNDKLDCARKQPFVSFLLWVYINTGKDLTLTGSKQLSHAKEMWMYLEKVHIMLDGVVKVIKDLKRSEVTSLILSNNGHISRREKSTTEHNCMTSHCNIPFVTNQDGELMPDVLIYVFEGVLPLIQAYYTTLFDGVHVSEDEVKISAHIASVLLQLADFMTTNNLLTSQNQWRMLSSAVIAVISYDCYSEEMINVDIEIKARFDKNIDNDQIAAECVTTKQYSELYDKELKLNKDFNNFVCNFQSAYWGPNKAQHQINSKYDTEYCENVTEKGIEWLPLGPKHQKHTNHFITRSDDCTTVHSDTDRIIDYLLISFNTFGSLNESERLAQESNNIKYIQLLRTIVHNEIKHIDPDLREEGNNPKEFRKQSERIQAVQNQLQELGQGSAITRLMKLLSHPNDKISDQVLALLTILVYSGNHNIQESFCSYFKNTREKSLFITLHRRLEHATASDNERRILLEQLQLKDEHHRTLKESYKIYANQYGFKGPTQQIFAGHKEEDLHVAVPQNQALIENDKEIEMQKLSQSEKKSQTGQRTFRDLVRGKSIQHLTVPECKPAVTAVTVIQKQKDAVTKEPPVHKYTQLESLKFRDTYYVKITLRFLGYLCDGQNRTMQNYLREQHDNTKRINLVSETCVFLQSFYVEVTEENIDLITEVLLTITEMCMGNYDNLLVIYNHQIIDIINRIIQTTVFYSCKLSKILKLKTAAIEVIEMMLEEIHPKSQDLAISVYKAVDTEALHSTLAYCNHLRQDEEMRKSKLDDDAERAAFTTYHILVHMADFPNITLDQLKPKKPKDEAKTTQDEAKTTQDEAKTTQDEAKTTHYSEIENAWKFCEKRSKCIEVIYKDKEGQTTLAKVHFNSKDQLSSAIKERVKVSVNRESPEGKIRDFAEWMNLVKKEVKHLNYLHDNLYTDIFVSYIHWFNHIVLLWTLLMNILLVVAWNSESPKRRLNGTEIVVPAVPELQDKHWFFSYVLYIGGAIHLLMSLGVAISHFLINYSNFAMPTVFNWRCKTTKSSSDQLNGMCKTTKYYSNQYFLGVKTMYHIVFVLCSALSLYFYGYFYCICLFHIVVDSDILQRVLKSITTHGSSLLWVAALGLIVIYVYSVGTFAFMPNDFDSNDGDTNLFCGTLFECFVTVLEYGLLDTIGLAVPLPANIKDATLRALFYDLTFFIIVTIIGLNIVFGIIVDTFSELRDERHRIEQDKKGVCFICNLPSLEFDRRTEGFENHIKHEHNMWNYIFYSLYLDTVDINDHTAIESYVYNQINEGETGYFPLFKARSLKEKEDHTLNELVELKRLINILVDHHQEEQRNAIFYKYREDNAERERRSEQTND